MWKDRLFWFSQPSPVLNNYDNYFFWIFLGLACLGLILTAWSKSSKHPVVRKLLQKFANASLWMSVTGIIWYGLRYENTPFFADRYWAALVFLILLIWLLSIVKYLLTQYRTEKSSFDRMQLNSKYIPGSKK